MIFWRKIVIFHTKYPKNFAPIQNTHGCHREVRFRHKMENKQNYQTVRTVPKSNRKIVERVKIDSPVNTQIHKYTTVHLYLHVSVYLFKTLHTILLIGLAILAITL